MRFPAAFVKEAAHDSELRQEHRAAGSNGSMATALPKAGGDKACVEACARQWGGTMEAAGAAAIAEMLIPKASERERMEVMDYCLRVDDEATAGIAPSAAEIAILTAHKCQVLSRPPIIRKPSQGKPRLR